MLNTQYGNYVKFIRGSENAWLNMSASEKNDDTLYFITSADGLTGKLYLGTKLISNGALSSATSLSELNDVVISEGITDQSILIYNNDSKRWEDKSILDVYLEISQVFGGATETEAGTAGLVPAPAIKDRNLYLRGDGVWADPTVSVLEQIEEINTTINTLVGVDTGVSIRAIAEDAATTAVASVIDDAPEAFDTLKEIATWINDHQDVADITGVSERVTDLEELLYGIPADEEAGTPATAGLQSVVSTLQEDLAKLESKHDEEMAVVEADIEDIKKAVKWQDIVE